MRAFQITVLIVMGVFCGFGSEREPLGDAALCISVRFKDTK